MPLLVLPSAASSASAMDLSEVISRCTWVSMLISRSSNDSITLAKSWRQKAHQVSSMHRGCAQREGAGGLPWRCPLPSPAQPDSVEPILIAADVYIGSASLVPPAIVCLQLMSRGAWQGVGIIPSLSLQQLDNRLIAVACAAQVRILMVLQVEHDIKPTLWRQRGSDL